MVRILQPGRPIADATVHNPHEASDRYLSRFPGISDPVRRSYVSMLSVMDEFKWFVERGDWQHPLSRFGRTNARTTATVPHEEAVEPLQRLPTVS